MNTSSPLLAPISRTGDPTTSKLAEVELNTSGRRITQKQQVLDALKRFPDTTAAELAQKSGVPHTACHKRLPDLEKDGLVEKHAVGTCQITKKPAHYWRLKVQA